MINSVSYMNVVGLANITMNIIKWCPLWIWKFEAVLSLISSNLKVILSALLAEVEVPAL